MTTVIDDLTLTDTGIGIFDEVTTTVMGAPPCEVPAGCPNENTATYACTLACCAQMVLICDDCMDSILEASKECKDAGITGDCLWCKSKIEPYKMFVSTTRL